MSSSLCIIKRGDFGSGKSEPMTALAVYLREEMERQGVSQLELERRSGIPDATLSRILNGTTKDPKASQLAQIASSLEIPFWRLMQHAGYTAEDPSDPSQEAQRLATLLEDRPELKAVMGKVANLSSEDQEAIQDYILLLSQRRDRRRRKKPRSGEESG
jgi:transcriptional regulator with XRE-family HTH domain